MQERRRGPENNLSGPRLPVAPRPTEPDELVADPAKGEAVPRCLTCGAPNTNERLLEFALILLPGSRVVGRYRLCGRCFRHANSPPNADPLTLNEVGR